MNRINFLDYTKAIAISFVIAVHVGFYQLNYLLLLVMPAFFIVTGYSFNPDKRSAKKSIALRFKSIMIPFWVFMLFYTLIELIRVQLFGYGTWEILISSLTNSAYGSGIIPIWGDANEYFKGLMSYKLQGNIGADIILPTNCHLWYLPATFSGYVVFALIAKRTKKSHLVKLISVVALLSFASLEVVFPVICQLPYGIGRGAIAAAFMLVGYWLRDYGAIGKKNKLFHIISCLVAAIVSVTAVLLGSDGSAMVRSYYGPYGAFSVFMTFIGGAAATWLMFELCRGIDNLKLDSVKRFLSFTGQNVFIIYLTHMAVKFLFDCIYVLFIAKGSLDVLDGYKMGLMPETSALYMIFEVVAVIAVCVLLAALKQRIQKKRKI